MEYFENKISFKRIFILIDDTLTSGDDNFDKKIY